MGQNISRCFCVEYNPKALFSAIHNNDIKLVRKYSSSENCAATNHLGDTPLILASKLGYINIVKILIKYTDVNLSNHNDETALICASKCNHYDVVKTLCINRAYCNPIDKQSNTALMWAARYGYYDLVNILRFCTAWDRQNDQGDTALSLARKNNHMRIVNLLTFSPNMSTASMAINSYINYS